MHSNKIHPKVRKIQHLKNQQ